MGLGELIERGVDRAYNWLVQKRNNLPSVVNLRKKFHEVTQERDEAIRERRDVEKQDNYVLEQAVGYEQDLREKNTVLTENNEELNERNLALGKRVDWLLGLIQHRKVRTRDVKNEIRDIRADFLKYALDMNQLLIGEKDAVLVVDHHKTVVEVSPKLRELFALDEPVEGRYVNHAFHVYNRQVEDFIRFYSTHDEEEKGFIFYIGDKEVAYDVKKKYIVSEVGENKKRLHSCTIINFKKRIRLAPLRKRIEREWREKQLQRDVKRNPGFAT